MPSGEHNGHPKGRANFNTRLTEKDVLDIRKSKLACSALAVIYGVSRQAIQKIKARQTWAWLTVRGTKRKYKLPA